MKAPKSTPVVAQKKLASDPSMMKRKSDAKFSSKKEATSKKIPGAPKRPPTAFFVYMEDFRKSYKENFPDNKSVAAVTKAGGEKWKSMSVSEKAPYVSKAATKKAEYEIAKEAFNKNQNVSTESGKSSSEVHDDAEQEASSF